MAVLEHERTVGQVVVRSDMATLPTCLAVDPFEVELLVHGVGTALRRVQPGPDLYEAVVVGSAAERAGPVPGGERSRLVEEEQLGEAAGLHQRRAVPAPELEPARDPPSHAEPAPDAPLVVVQAAAVAVHEAPGRVRDEVAERCDSVLSRHCDGTVAPAG